MRVKRRCFLFAALLFSICDVDWYQS